MINFDYNLLLSQFQSKTGAAGSTAKKAPTAPWTPGARPPAASERVRAALDGKPILDVAGARKKLPKSEEDYAELFALYNALETLKAMAQRSDSKDVGRAERTLIDRKFALGMKDVSAFIETVEFDKLKLARGAVTQSVKTGVGVRRDQPEYKTGIVHRGAFDMPVESLQGDVRFTMAIAGDAVPTKTINFDLAEMGGTPRTLGEVVKYVNGKLQAAGALTRFDREKLPPETRTVQVGGKTVSLPDGPERWSLKIVGSGSERLSFSAPVAADAVYLAQSVGALGSRVSQLAKFQTDLAPNGLASAAPAAYRTPGEANWVDGRVYTKALDGDITAVRASATHTDGSVYMLAEVVGVVADQTIKGVRDVALLKYDPAGNLVFSRTLGAAAQADASALAVAADGTVAIGGSVQGELMGAASSDRAKLDSFVTVFNGEGEELWTRRGGSSADDRVRALAFGADGALYVSGQVAGSLAGATSSGGTDAWLRAYRTTSTVQADNSVKSDAELMFSTQYGTAGDDIPSSIAVAGTVLVTAGVENGRAVVRRFDLQPMGAPLAAGVRDIGSLAGGSLSGIALVENRVVLVGSTGSASLAATSALNAHSGGRDAFVANLGVALGDGTDTVAYYGGAGQEQVTGVAFRGRDVYLSGTSDAAIGGTAALGKTDGFVARLDWRTAAAEWTRRFTGKDGEVATGPIAIAAGGASVLDRLGLPSGAIDYTGSQLVTAATSARAGDRFYVKAGEFGRRVAVTLDAKDTLKTLSTKITRAVGFNATLEIIKDLKLEPGPGGLSGALYERLQLKPKSDRTPIEIEAGEGGRDLLEALGLEEGVVRAVRRNRKGEEITPPGGKMYGLKLARDLALATKADVKRTVGELADAATSVQIIYRDLSNALKPKGAVASGPVPVHLQKQLANYQAGLARLGR